MANINGARTPRSLRPRGSARRLNQRARVHRVDDPGIASKIRHVQSKQIRNAVNQHSGHQTRVVYLDTRDAAIPDDLPPDFINGGAIGGELHHAFEPTDFPLGGFACETEAVLVRRASPNIPELGDILVRVVKHRAILEQSFERAIYDPIRRIVAPRNTQQNVRINQVRRSHTRLHARLVENRSGDLV